MGGQGFDGGGAEVHATEPSIDPGEVAQVADERGRIVERTIKQFRGIGAAVHAAERTPARPVAHGRLHLMPIVLRRLVPLAFALLLLAALAPGTSAASTHAFPVQSLGNRGSDVRAIQGLLRAHGATIAVDGIFGTTTKDAVKAFQAANGLSVDGHRPRSRPGRSSSSPSDPATPARRSRPPSASSTTSASAGLSVNGLYDTATRKAVHRLPEAHRDDAERQHRAGHLAEPRLALRLPGVQRGQEPVRLQRRQRQGELGDGRGDRPARGGGDGVRGAGPTGGSSVGDGGYEHGGNIPGHQTHERGLDIDIRPIRDNEDQCTWGTNWRFASYDRSATRALIKIIRATAPGHVKLIYFNDPVLIREGLTTLVRGHDDHLHIRYCERYYPVALYRC